MRVLEIERVLRGLERALDRGVRAARILPELLSRCEAVSERYLILRRVMEAGVREVAVDVEHRVADHPYPPEVLEVIRVIRGFGRATYVRRGNGAAYVYLFEMNFNRYYAVVPYREWPRLIGEPDLDLGGGLRAFSTQVFLEYLDRCWEYCRAASFCWPSPEESLQKASEELERARMVVEESAFILPLGGFSRGYLEQYCIVNDGELRSRGVRVVRPLSFDVMFEWIREYGDRIFYCVLGEDEADGIEERYRAEVEGVAERSRLMEGVWRGILEKGMISYDLVRVRLEDLGRLLEATEHERRDRILRALEELCDPEIYLQADKYGMHEPYRGAGLSAYYPLRALYLVRRLRDKGFSGARIVKRVSRVRGLPSLLVSIDESIYIPRSGHWKILVKPRRDLRVEYPCEARWDGGSIVVVDGNMLEGALADAR